jgi:hypothetical protein
MDTLVLGAVLGAALTLAVQLGVVPMVQPRARRSGHWEQAVRDLKELLMTSLSDRATDAHAAQGLYVDLLKLEAEPGQDPAPGRPRLRFPGDQTVGHVAQSSAGRHGLRRWLLRGHP